MYEGKYKRAVNCHMTIRCVHCPLSKLIIKGGIIMIELTAINNTEFILNADHIEKIESVPETLITLTNGKQYIVLETLDEVKNKVLKYKNKIFTYKI